MGKKKDALGDRMKERYESAQRMFLTRRVPVIIRIDGKAFHTFTRGFKKPFDACLMESMQRTMKYLCENIQGCVFGYTQSDEITLVLTDYATITTDAWFGYNVQKMTSIAASMATLAFNRFFAEATSTYRRRVNALWTCTEEESRICAAYEKAIEKGAMFDARAFSMPVDEVCNCLVWRQQDAIRNSIEAVGQAYFSANELHGKNQKAIKEMCLSQYDVDWEKLPATCQRGSSCYRVPVTETIEVPGRDAVEVTRNKFLVDDNTPVFSNNREFVERWL